MIWTGIGLSLSALLTAPTVTAAAYLPLKGRTGSGDDTTLFGLLPDGSRMALMGKKT